MLSNAVFCSHDPFRLKTIHTQKGEKKTTKQCI